MPNSSPFPAKAERTKEKIDTGRAAPKEQKNGPSASRSVTVSYEQIAQRAYEIYERDGRQEGRELENWLQAEAELGISSSH
jgi:hypothetical protein